MIPDEAKTKEQLINELIGLRQRVAELETSETERKKAEIPLPDSNEYQRLFELSPMGIVVLDMKGVITSCNSAVCMKSGYPKDDLVGKHFSKVSAIRAGDIPKFMKVFASLIRGKVPKPFEVMYTRKDGTTGWTEAHISLLKLSGKRIGIQVIQNDVTERKRAEETLRKSEEKYRSLVNNVKLGVFRSTPEPSGKFLEVNPAMEEITEYSREELLQMNVCDLYVRPEERESVLKEIASTIGKTIKELHLRKKDATEIVVSDTKVAVRDDTGKILYFDGIIEDITERKQAEQKLEHLNAVLYAIRNVNQLITREKDRDRLLESICDSLIETRGYYNAWIALLDESRRLLVTAEAGLGKAFLPMVKRLKRGELTICGQRALSQSEVIVTEDPFSSCTDCPLANKYSGRGALTVRLEHGGKVYGLLCASIPAALTADEEEQALFREVAGDITLALHGIELEEEYKQAEAELVRLSNAVRMSTDSIVISDLEGKITDVNEATLKMYGTDNKADLIGISSFELIAPQEREKALAGTKEVMERGYVKDREYHVVTKNGSKLPVEMSISIMKGADGEPIGFVGIIRDITERKQAEEREKQLQQELYLSSRLAAIGELAAGVAHEINNPLTGILGFSQRLLRKSTDEKVSLDLARIHNEALRAAKVVENLLTFARRRQPKRDYSDINDIMQKILELRDYELKTGNIEVELDLAPSLRKIIVDSHQIQEVFLNIILNTEQAMTEASRGGKLTIKTQETKGYIRITFTDDGPGIAAAALDKLFDPFFTTRGEKGGTGLGLGISHGIVTEHGGKIYARSKPGKGASFFVELPLTTKK